MKAERGEGGLYRQKDSAYWWMRYSLRGKQYRESTKIIVIDDGPGAETSRKEAQKVLRRRLQEVGADLIGAKKFITPQAERITVGKILDDLVDDLKLREKYSAPTRSHLNAVRAEFGNQPLVAVTTAVIRKYIQKCRAADVAKATINRRTQLLGQAWGLAGKIVGEGPKVLKLSEADNVRQGFLDPEVFEEFVVHLPEDLQDFARWGYLTGWRKSTITRLEWTMFDMRAGTMDVPGTITKNRKPLKIPLQGTLGEIIARRWEKRSYKQADGTTVISAHVFYREFKNHFGSPVAYFTKAWKRACTDSGMKILFHDFRRSAVRNLTRAGVDQTVAMAITGHKTASVFQRYNITDDRDLECAVGRLDNYLGETAAAPSKVLPFARKKIEVE
jgi:integrase